MGSMDRDYMHDRFRRPRASRPFGRQPDRSGWGTLGIVLVFVVLLFFLYQVADRKLQQRPASQPALVSAAPPARAPLATPKPALLIQPVGPDSSYPAANVFQVTKCVTSGRTSYSDAACAQGSVSSQVTTRANHNLLSAVRPTADSPAEATPATQHIVEVQTRPISDAETKKTECDWLDAQIKHWDSMARQPQGAQTQDWISEQRKQARDRQFRSRCR